MDDMNTFERAVAGEVVREMGPSRSVDPSAVFAAAVTNGSPKWRFQSMFSATKFVVAGAVVALFGGFLLSGVLTQQPSDERLPAVGASATATAQAEPTDAATSEPEPTTEAVADVTTPDLLPGVDLVSEEVEPGVYRVLSDGVRGLRNNTWDVAVTSDGSVWVEKHSAAGPCFGHTARNSRVLRLGSPGVAVPDIKWDMKAKGKNERCEPLVGPGLRFGSVRGGSPVVLRHEEDNREVFSLGDAGWVAASEPAVIACGLAADHGEPSLLAPDGACWTPPLSARAEAMGTEVAHRVDVNGERTVIRPEDLGWDNVRFGRFAADPEGTVWTGLYEGDSFSGLAAFDGEAWSRTLLSGMPGLDPATSQVTDLAVTPDGKVWVALHESEDAEALILSWDGDDWVKHGLIQDQPASWAPLRLGVASDGSVWLDGQYRFDGDSMLSIDLPAHDQQHKSEIAAAAHAPDGSIWLVQVDGEGGFGGLYVITPEAVPGKE